MSFDDLIDDICLINKMVESSAETIVQTEGCFNRDEYAKKDFWNDRFAE